MRAIKIPITFAIAPQETANDHKARTQYYTKEAQDIWFLVNQIVGYTMASDNKKDLCIMTSDGFLYGTDKMTMEEFESLLFDEE